VQTDTTEYIISCMADAW